MKVTLLKPHKHAGIDRQVGDEIDVNEAQAIWLAEQKVIESKSIAGKQGAGTNQGATA